MSKPYTVVSLFSGAMGLDIGMGLTGRFKLIACVEHNHAACETIRRNQAAGRLDADLIVLERDITTLSGEDLLREVGAQVGQVDVVVGGPPCQSYSTAGRRGATLDPRGTLVQHFVRLVLSLRPRFFIMENVRGLMSAKLPTGDSVVRSLADDLGVGGYVTDCFEVNAVNYGAPQLRERVLLVGNREDLVVDFPDPTHGPGTSLPWKTLRDVLVGIDDPDPVRMEFSPRKLEYLSQVTPGSNWRSLPAEIQQKAMGSAYHAKGGRSGWWRRLSYDLPCPTLVTMPNHASTSLCHPGEVRALTLAEYARIQEFPDKWEFYGTPAERFRQVGNAVPIRLGAVVGGVVADALDGCARQGDRLDALRIVYINSHVRTKSWLTG